jgi:hypothetical protein
LITGERPTFLGKLGDHSELQRLVEFLRMLIIGQMIGEQSERELRRAAPVIAPLESGDAVFAKIKPGIERNAIYSDMGQTVLAFAFVMLH